MPSARSEECDLKYGQCIDELSNIIFCDFNIVILGNLNASLIRKTSYPRRS